MSTWSFVGRVPASKSLLNRALIVQSFFPEVVIDGDSDCDDVNQMKVALSHFKDSAGLTESVYDAGHAGTVLRFLALRLSRKAGLYTIKGSKRLMARPQEELLQILSQLGVQTELHPDRMVIRSDGWRLRGDTLLVPSHRSSQFASSVLLNSWDLPFDLYVTLGPRLVSDGYFKMTLKLMQTFGLQVDFWDQDFRVRKAQTPKGLRLQVEPDMSSSFALAGLAAVAGSVNLLDHPLESLQPDHVFVSLLQQMGVPCTQKGTTLKIEKAAHLKGLRASLGSAPDLFPVLAALCGLADGDSALLGAPHLVHKESNRLLRMAEVLRQMGRTVDVKDDGLLISGVVDRKASITLDCDMDHRLAFAGAVLLAAGLKVELHNRDVVNKSFPEFWQIFAGLEQGS